MMEQHVLLIEYLKEQYTQARQHETLRTNCTTFLTSSAGIIIGLHFKDSNTAGSPFFGIVIFLIGLANYQINKSHFFGNRFHTTVAKYARTELEKIPEWTVHKPCWCRNNAAQELGLRNPVSGEIESIGGRVQRAIQRIPIGLMALGLLISTADVIRIYGLQNFSLH